MILQRLINTNDEKDVVFDICIPCWDRSTKLNETLTNIMDSSSRLTLPVKIIVSVEKQSVVRNRLACLTQSRSPYVLWLDDDVKFEQPGWDKHLFDTITKDQRLGVIGVNVVHHQAGNLNPTRPHGLVPGLCGAVMMTRKVDGINFDDNYVGSQWEDSDICVAYNRAGYNVFQDNRVYVIHYNEEKNREYTNNRAYFNKKWNLNW